MFEVIASYFGFIGSQILELMTPLRIWCFYEQFGLRTIMMLVNTGIIAFALPNILDQSECKLDRDSYIKSLYESRHCRMKCSSWVMLALALMTILTYLSIWNGLSNQHVCAPFVIRSGGPERFAGFLALINILTLAVAIFALQQKIFCMKHKQ